MSSVRTCEPVTISQGERLEWTKTVSGYPADLWTLDYRYRGNGSGINVTATADGTNHLAAITAVQSSTLSPGNYLWQAWVTEIADATNTFSVAQGSINVRQGFVSGDADPVETRSAAQITLDSIDAAMLAFSTSDVIEYEIETPAGRRRVKRSDKTNLLNLRKHYAMMVSLERTRDRLRKGGTLMQSIGIRVSE